MRVGSLNSRLQKGGAVLTDMRMLCRAWKEGGLTQAELQTVLAKETHARCRDVVVRCFRPRFMEGNPPNAWKLCQTIENHRADPASVLALYYWLTARSEHLMAKFVQEELYSCFLQGLWHVDPLDTKTWLQKTLQQAQMTWTPTVQAKVIRGLLAALRDFGILEGRNHKKIAPPDLSPEAVALIAFLLHEHDAVSGRMLVEHEDWRLFLFTANTVERLLLEAHQIGALNYQSAGSTVRIEFPTSDFATYAGKLFK